MKKILFMCINMNIGGTEKALLTMLNEMDRRKYDITLFMLEEHGGFLNQIPDGVKIGSVSLSPRGDLRMPSDIAKIY